mmetsp:Transcript_3391/g.5763  ORF Transcript_3391/g.5763 Transcript_3391/m.5763 type:complete len:249 (-) Transcript_3391:1512-2258(-)
MLFARVSGMMRFGATRLNTSPVWIGCSVQRSMSSIPHRRMLAKQYGDGNRVKASQEVAHAMPLSYKEMDNSTLVTLAAMDNHDATVEMLIRHIMSRDRVNYPTALKSFLTIKDANNSGVLLRTLPHGFGITLALSAGLASIPLCFHLETVHAFNEYFVTADIPEPKDLETWLEVGSWAWNWMEPPLGQLSFLILCLQFTNDQLNNLGVRPLVSRLKDARAQRVIQAFPQYDAGILESFSKTAPLTQES